MDEYPIWRYLNFEFQYLIRFASNFEYLEYLEYLEYIQILKIAWFKVLQSAYIS